MKGKYKGRQVLPAATLKATLEPSIALDSPSVLGRVKGTRPSHALADYAGACENPAYGFL